ncbi:MAG: PQQ-binding-like beta-propeller repeat protein [Marmoricola sp.]
MKTQHRVWLPAVLVLALVAAAVVVLVVRRGHRGGCAGSDRPLAAGSVSSPFDTGHDPVQPGDRRLSRLVSAARGWRRGHVVGAVGYDYGQWLTVAGLPGRLGTWTKRNARFAVLDPDRLAPAWGIEEGADPHAYDTSGTRFFGIEEPKHSPPEVTSYALSDGNPAWCATVGSRPLGRDGALSTLALPGGDLLALSGPRHRITLSRVGAGVDRSRPVTGVGRADFLGGPWHGVVVAGGRPQYELGAARPGGAVVSGLGLGSRRTRWRYRVPSGTGVHVLGGTPRTVVMLRQGGRGQRLVGLEPATGRTRWSTRPRRPVLDAALFGGVVVVREQHGLRAYDADTGRAGWFDPVPTRPQPYPYGFVLAEQPMPDSGHVLLGQTRALVSVDLATGRMRRYRLPVDGINTTWWPYQLVVTRRLLVVVTNTGAVALRLPAS